MDCVDWSSAAVGITYDRARVSLTDAAGKFEPANLNMMRDTVKTVTGLGRSAFECWHRLYVQKEDPEKVFKYADRDPGGALGENAALADGTVRQLKSLARCEDLETDLPDIV
jgi:hypothetical protein